MNKLFALFALMCAFFTHPLSADHPQITTTLINKFTKDYKLYLIVDKGICYQVTMFDYYCEDWTPGDPLKIERKTSDNEITNLITKSRVYAKFAYVQNSDCGDLKQKVSELEARVLNLEALIRK